MLHTLLVGVVSVYFVFVLLLTSMVAVDVAESFTSTRRSKVR